MDKRLFSRRFTSPLSNLDKCAFAWMQKHSHLLMALVNLALAVWALSTGRGQYVFGIALIGAVGYFSGLIVALSSIVITMGIDVSLVGVVHISLSSLFVELVGYLNIAWLGFLHKRLKEEQRHEIDEKHPDSIMSWTAVNEIRTSLAAIRYLLFPIQSEHVNRELQKATIELLRLEQLFQDLELKDSAEGTRRQ